MDIYALAEIAEAAQVEIQANFTQIDPVIGVSRSLRDAGFAVDVMTIDCLKSGKRITLLVKDEQPGELFYQLGFRDSGPGALFSAVAFEQLSCAELCRWITAYFAAG